jgi:hypothetical protein
MSYQDLKAKEGEIIEGNMVNNGMAWTPSR